MALPENKTPDGKTPDPADNGGAGGNSDHQDPQGGKEFGQEEVNEIVSKRLNKNNEKHAKALEEYKAGESERIDAAVAKALKNAELSEEEKASEELKAEREKLEQERASHEAEKKKLAIERYLASKNVEGLSHDLLLNAEPEQVEDFFENVLSKHNDATVKEMVEDRLKGKTPTNPNGNGNDKNTPRRAGKRYM